MLVERLSPIEIESRLRELVGEDNFKNLDLMLFDLAYTESRKYIKRRNGFNFNQFVRETREAMFEIIYFDFEEGNISKEQLRIHLDRNFLASAVNASLKETYK